METCISNTSDPLIYIKKTIIYCSTKQVNYLVVKSYMLRETLNDYKGNHINKTLQSIYLIQLSLCCAGHVASPKFNKLKKGGNLKTLDSKPGV